MNACNKIFPRLFKGTALELAIDFMMVCGGVILSSHFFQIISHPESPSNQKMWCGLGIFAAFYLVLWGTAGLYEIFTESRTNPNGPTNHPS